MSDIEIRLAQMKEVIERYVLHPYLRKYINLPKIDEDKLLILISIADQLDLSPKEKNSFIIAIMLMNIALDTHDHVSNTLNGEKSLKARQLTILAGDYYSGLYYKCLAKVENIEMIQKLSQGVKRINEHKVNIYSKNQNTVSEVMESVKIIEFALVEEFTQSSNFTNWNKMTSNFLLLKRLIEEKEQFENTGESVVLRAMNRSTSEGHQNARISSIQQKIVEQCEDYIERTRRRLVNEMENLFPQINSSLKQRLIEITRLHDLVEKTYVEEG
ncbi:heptaprenyl diphosphate synthase component 1 [Niallia sp. Krafla_26]|uniref:heptaprenyl diphosphate synthase component 1 n=1 Tax=Niallia sp. Krafla_26 TaxID=3064703 RepID=UPI003D17996B